MKILLLTDERGSPKSAGGGYGHLLYVLRPAVSLGHEVRYMTADDIKYPYFSIENKKRKLEELEKTIKDFKPDIINIFNNCIWGFEPFEIADKFNIPTILTTPDYMLFCKNRMIFKPDRDALCDLNLDNCVLCKSSMLGIPENTDIKNIMKNRRIIVASNFLKECIVKSGFSEENISVVELGVNPKDFVPSYGGNSGEILNISRIATEKGIDLYDIMASKAPELKWLLAGYPEMKFTNTCFDYLGEISDRDKKFLLRNCEVFVSTPRWHEPVGFTYLEAKASGKPIVGFRLGGIPQYHENTGGAILVDYPNMDEMVKVIRELHSDENRRIEMGKSGRKQIEERNNENVLIHQTLKIYSKELSK